MPDVQNKFQSTPSLRRATEEFAYDRLNDEVSIHALLAESDCINLLDVYDDVVSIHALLAESDTNGLRLM